METFIENILKGVRQFIVELSDEKDYVISNYINTLYGKQDKLTAGDSIDITDNVISTTIPLDSIVEMIYSFHPEKDYLNFYSNIDNTQVRITTNYYGGGDIDYSFDRKNWIQYTMGDWIVIPNAGDRIFFRGDNPNGFRGSTQSDDTGTNSKFVFTKPSGSQETLEIYANGNIQSLLVRTNFDKYNKAPNNAFVYMFRGCSYLKSAPILPATELGKDCYQYMFRECTSLTVAPELPAIELADHCYAWMFRECTSLTVAPKLPAGKYNVGKLNSACYASMFYGCTSLTTAPELPATVLADSCYAGMFYGCTSLTTAPELPATTLVYECYRSMFYGCTSLTTAPQSLGTECAQYCCYLMFYGCTSLTTAPELPATVLGAQCYANMFASCTSLTTAPELPATTLVSGCYDQMFFNCTSLTTAPELPATILVYNCYFSMFKKCTNLNYIKCLAEDISATQCVVYWVENVGATGTFIKSSNMNDWGTGISGIPSGWTVQDNII